MDNTKNYIIISIISVVMMVPYYIWDCKILNICSGIGCSALTASVMALYIEKNNAKKEPIIVVNAAKDIVTNKLLSISEKVYFSESLASKNINFIFLKKSLKESEIFISPTFNLFAKSK